MYNYDQLSRTLITKAAHGENIAKFSLSPEQGIIGLVYTSQSGVILPSAYIDERFDRTIDKKRMSVTRDMICVPLKAGGDCVGCLEVANKRGLKFTKEDFKLASSIARELAVGILSRSERVDEFLKEKSIFKGRIRSVADKNLLSPLLKSILLILTEILKSEV